MTASELALDDIATALNRLALVIATLVLILIVLSWSLDDMNLHIHLFGVMLRRAVPAAHTLPCTPDAPCAPDASAVPVVPASAPAAQKATKAASREDHAK